jgi:hypothetical protein
VEMVLMAAVAVVDAQEKSKKWTQNRKKNNK